MNTSKNKKNNLKDLSPFFIDFWRIIFFSLIASVLGLLFINNGWSIIDTRRIHIKGNKYIEKERIIKSMGINIPIHIMGVNPKQIEESLITLLPVINIKSSRRISPPGVYIEILEREPVALATRKVKNKIEKGLIDKEAYWISLDNSVKSNYNIENLYLSVDGWIKSHQKWIAFIYENRNKLNSPLKKIIVSPNGDISLQTENFDLIDLGYNPLLLKEQFSTLAHLTNSLPTRFINELKTKIDLKDPSKPKLHF